MLSQGREKAVAIRVGVVVVVVEPLAVDVVFVAVTAAAAAAAATSAADVVVVIIIIVVIVERGEKCVCWRLEERDGVLVRAKKKERERNVARTAAATTGKTTTTAIVISLGNRAKTHTTGDCSQVTTCRLSNENRKISVDRRLPRTRSPR